MKRGVIAIFIFVIVLTSFASAAPHDDYPGFSEKYFDINGNTLTTSDKLVYTTGYVSINGQAWVPFTLNGDQYENYPFLLDGGQANLPSSLNNPGTHYIIVFSCSLENNAWNCHGDSPGEAKWQLEVVRNSGGNDDDFGECGDTYCNNGETCSSCQEDCGACGTHVLVQNGNPRAQIITSSSAPPIVNVAALELQNTIRKMSGATLPIRNSVDNNIPFKIYVGESSYTNSLGITDAGCRDGGFKMISGSDYLVLLGDDTQFEIKGPTNENEWHALTGKNWGNGYLGDIGRRHSSRWDIWEGDQKGSYNAVYEFLYGQGARWYYPGDLGEVIPSRDTITFNSVQKTVNPDFGMRDYYTYYMTLRDSDSNQDEFWWMMRLRLNAQETYTSYPAEHGLDPMTDGYNGDKSLCSQEMLDETVEFVKALIDIYDLYIIDIMPHDGYSDVGCGSMSQSDFVWEFMNNVAWEIYNEYGIDRKVISHGYSNYRSPPSRLSQPIAPNLGVHIVYSRAEIEDSDRSRERNSIDDWVEFFEDSPGARISTGSYYLENWHGMYREEYLIRVPGIFPHTIQRDLQYIFARGIRDDEVETSSSWTPSWDDWGYCWEGYTATGFASYITSKLYWDVDLNLDALLEEYYDLYYGPASDEMKEFYEYAESIHQPSSSQVSSVKNTMSNLLSQARSASGGGVYGERIDMFIDMVEC